MGCIFSSGRKVRERDSPSFAEYVGGGTGFVAAAEKRAGKAGCDSRDVAFVVQGGKAGAANKLPEMSSLLGRAGVYGLDKAVEVLDTLGSSMSSLTPSSGFISGVATRGNKIAILAFEVANTIAKGSNLMQSLSEENIQFLRKDILPSDGVQRLVSTDARELLKIAASDKREELHVFSVEVIRFGDLCKDPEWHNLGRFFQKLDSDPTPQEKLREEAETTMQQLVNLAQSTSELYHELHALDRFEQDYKRKAEEEEALPSSRRGDSLMILHSELKHQRKLVKSLKKKSLWSRNLEEVVEKLVDVVIFIHKEILEAFGLTGHELATYVPFYNPKRLGVFGLALHYANVINQIDNIVARPISLPPNTRDTFYNGLPVGVKASLRLRLQSFPVKEPTVPQIKAEMQKILQWLAPMADNTIKAHQGFGWVGEWANMGTEANRKNAQRHSMFRIQTLHHADREKTEEYILQLVVWLHHLVDQVKNKGFGFNSSKTGHLALKLPSRKTKNDTCRTTLLKLSPEDRELIDGVAFTRPVFQRSRSQGFINEKEKTCRRKNLCRSSGNSPARALSKTLDFQSERMKDLDVIDGLERIDTYSVFSLC